MKHRLLHKVGILLIIFLLGVIFLSNSKNPEDIILNLASTDLEKTGGRTNLLLLGIGGVEHDGGELTDTIMIASLNHSRKSIEMISIPRDLMIANFAREIYEPEYAKVNMAYWLGKKQDINQRFKGVKSAIKDITDLTIHNVMLVDFKGFEALIDDLGGLVIDVERSFTDRQYPNNSYGYMTIHFQQGLQQMSGKKALQYVRSRHGNNGEEGDFARSRRQQNVINAIREKALSLELLTSPKKIEQLYETARKHFITDIGIRQMISLGKFAKDINRANITKMSITEGDNGLLHVPLLSFRNKHFGGAYGLFPDGATFVYIHKLIEIYLDNPSVLDSDFSVEILNGTRTAGIANETAIPLKSRAFKIKRVDNTYNRKRYTESVIIDRSGGTMEEKISQIRTLTGIHNVTTENIEPNFYRVDATIVIGDDY